MIFIPFLSYRPVKLNSEFLRHLTVNSWQELHYKAGNTAFKKFPPGMCCCFLIIHSILSLLLAFTDSHFTSNIISLVFKLAMDII